MAEMDLGLSARGEDILARARAMIADEIAPLEAEFLSEVGVGDRWQLTGRQSEILSGLKDRAKISGLWNLWLTDPDRGGGLSTAWK